MDLRQLEILQAIAETGSFTACGRRLHVSQSAISRQILLLEDELGEPLFLRVGRQVRMTPAAESLVQLGQRVFQDVRETLGTISDRTSELRGTLRLSGGMTVCLYVFPTLLKHLRRVHPSLDVRLTVATAGQSLKEIFTTINQRCQQSRSETREDSHQECRTQLSRAQAAVRHHRENGAGAE